MRRVDSPGIRIRSYRDAGASFPVPPASEHAVGRFEQVERPVCPDHGQELTRIGFSVMTDVAKSRNESDDAAKTRGAWISSAKISSFSIKTAAWIVSMRPFMPMRTLSYLSLPWPCTRRE